MTDQKDADRKGKSYEKRNIATQFLKGGAAMNPVKGEKRFQEMPVGRHLLLYDSLVVLTHFKGHAMGGFGGSLKNIAIGCVDGPVGKKVPT